ncbi:Uncharacterized [Syntrophomonas zehnderi OL-4]|uniref:Uncharacterized n=1 Tax=Syntrophomonas zehnderi OL-4 TaxID=690567 RepID=A0A0E4GCF6_9FIRM|nr:hypothetical protein [Syntrophomonas zehnderi]CFX13597.1 Uncharacterized [Syntrophomonas zehnderi OL-4]
MGELIITMQMSLDGVVSQEDRWMSLSEEILEDYLAYYKTVAALRLWRGQTLMDLLLTCRYPYVPSQ